MKAPRVIQLRDVPDTDRFLEKDSTPATGFRYGGRGFIFGKHMNRWMKKISVDTFDNREFKIL